QPATDAPERPESIPQPSQPVMSSELTTVEPSAITSAPVERPATTPPATATTAPPPLLPTPMTTPAPPPASVSETNPVSPEDEAVALIEEYYATRRACIASVPTCDVSGLASVLV